MSKKDIWRLWSAHGKCVLWDALSGYSCSFPWRNQLCWERPQNLKKVVVSSMGKCLFYPKAIACDSVDTAGDYNMWQAGHGWEAETYHAQLDRVIFGASTGISKPILLVPIVPEGADIHWPGPLGMCWVKGSTEFWHLAEVKPVEITHWHISNPKGWIRDTYSDYCML